VVRDQHGNFVARTDMGWREVKVCSEFEGRQHASGEQFRIDVARYPALVSLGWLPLRYTDIDVYRRPAKLLVQAERALRQCGLNW
jgi:very-short-patch-repair endonuclease